MVYVCAAGQDRSNGDSGKADLYGKEVSFSDLEDCELILNRVFASSQFRGHQKSLEQTPRILKELEEHKVPVINPGISHRYETDKALTAKVLEQHGIPVPEIYGIVRRGGEAERKVVLSMCPETELRRENDVHIYSEQREGIQGGAVRNSRY